MAGFEDLIRGALEKQGSPSPDRREAIYTSSRQALERMMGQNAALDEKARQVQRTRLEEAIVRIEADYAPPAPPPIASEPGAPAPFIEPAAPDNVAAALPPVAPSPAAPAFPPRPSPQASQPQADPGPTAIPVSRPAMASIENPKPMAAPAVPAPSREVTTPLVPTVTPQPSRPPAQAATRREPSFDTSQAPRPTPAVSVQPATMPRPPVEGVQPSTSPFPSRLEPEFTMERQVVASTESPRDYDGRDYDGDVLNERKPYAKFLLWTIIVAGIGMSIWWAVNFGPDMVMQKLGGSVPNPSETIESGSFIPPVGEGWVTVFEPSEDSGNIDASGRGTVNLFQDEGRTYVRIASNEGASANSVRIKVPRGVMAPLQGKAATFEMVLKNASDTPHQFAIFCEFGTMGNCGRKRFRSDQQAEAFIFDVLVNDAALAADEEAWLSFNTDLGGTGKALDLYSIRVRGGV